MTTLHLGRLRCEEAKGKAGQVQSHNSHSLYSTARGHGTEGRPPDMWPLTKWNWQCSQHARREHRCQVPFGEDTWKFLQEAKQAKNMYLEDCLQQRWHFTSFFASVDRLLGVEATDTLKRLASCLAKNWRQPYSRTCGYVKSRVTITLVGSTHRCIQGSRVPGFSFTILVSSACCGMTALGSTYSGKRAEIS